MKKFVLSVATVAMFAGFANAEVYTLNVKDATEIVGTEHAEVAKGETDENGQVSPNGNGKHVQPLESVVLGDFDLSFGNAGGSNEPAYYYPMSTNASGTCQIRLYGSNSITISAPADMPMGKVVVYDARNKKDVTIYTGEPKAEVTYSTGEQIRIETITITVGESGDTPVTPPSEDGVLYSALSEDDADISAGWEIDVDKVLPDGLNYIWSWKTYNNKSYLNASGYYQKAYAAKAYAVSPVIDLRSASSAALTFDHAAKFQTNLREDCKAVARVKGDTGWTVLNIPTWPEAGAWDFIGCGEIDLSAFVGNEIQIGFLYVSKEGSADTWEIRNLKIIGAQAGVADMEIDEVAAPVYFNLQGVRVDNPENGLFIEVKGCKTTKVIF